MFYIRVLQNAFIYNGSLMEQRKLQEKKIYFTVCSNSFLNHKGT